MELFVVQSTHREENMSKNVMRRMRGYVRLVKAMKPARQTGRFYHATFICKKRKVIAIGFNNFNKVLPVHKWGEYDSDRNGTSYVPSIHSELSAIIKCGHEDCSQFDFYNIRINNHNEIACSKPCPNCQRILEQVGFNKVYYFDEDGKLCSL